MIAYLVGSIEEKRENSVIVDVNGIGYELTVSNNTLVSLPIAGETVKILTYMQVKEDGICLFGFATDEEKAMFLKLITVSGIGPKMAIGILSGIKLSDLVIAIVNEDSTLLSKIKGLGKKTAERLCLELKDKITTNGIPLLEADSSFSNNYNENALNDAVETLISLGVNKNEAYRLARSKATADITAEEIILKVLKELGK